MLNDMKATYTGPLTAGSLRLANGSEVPFERGQEIELPEGLNLNPEQWEVAAAVTVEIKTEKE